MAQPPFRFVVSSPACDPSCSGSGSDACSYRVAWSINPHMTIGAAHPQRAIEQHRALVKTLVECGADVTVVPFVHGAFDSVFAKDNAVIVERQNGRVDALLAAPRHAERSMEQAARAKALRAHGIRVDIGKGFEGGDVIVLPNGGGIFLGHGFRSSPDARAELERYTGRSVTCLELREPELYHLDMVLSVLDDGTAFVCEEALGPGAVDAIERHPAITGVVRVPLAEALAFGLNLVQVRSSVIKTGRTPALDRALAQLGYTIRIVDLGEFHHAGGGAACLVARVHRYPDVAERSTSVTTTRGAARPAAAAPVLDRGPDSRRAA